MRIYIAGALSTTPYSEDTRSPSKVVTDYISNIYKMCKAAKQVIKKGHAPYVPALDFLLGVVTGDWEEKDYRNMSIAFLDVCDALVVISMSKGVAVEVNRAIAQGKKIYKSLAEVPYIGKQ